VKRRTTAPAVPIWNHIDLQYNIAMQNRKVTYRLYPNASQQKKMLNMLGVHQRLYNRALEQRIQYYKENQKSLSFANQCKSLTVWRKEDEQLNAINAQSQQVTLKRLALAFQAFFRRLKSGDKPGFPRFKSFHRYPGWGYKTHGDGFRVFVTDDKAHGRIRLSDIGLISMRGNPRNRGEVKTCEILHKAGKWYASITIECEPKRTHGKNAIGFDWGVETFVTGVDNTQVTIKIDNPRFLRNELPKLKKSQQDVSRKTNKKSHNRKKCIVKLSKLHAKIANQRKEFSHQKSAEIVKRYALIATEQLSVKPMTASGGAYKKGLNREILSTAPSKFLSLVKTKAEEAGAWFVEIPTRKVKPSQTCHGCGAQKKKSLSERYHVCECGVRCSRDENAARVILNWALDWASGQKLAELGSRGSFTMLNQKTPAIPFC